MLDGKMFDIRNLTKESYPSLADTIFKEIEEQNMMSSMSFPVTPSVKINRNGSKALKF